MAVQQKAKKRKLRPGRLAVLIIAVALIVFLGVAVGAAFAVLLNTSRWQAGGPVLDAATIVFDRYGKPADQIHAGEYRLPVTFDQIPAHLKDAFLAVEDIRFYEHHGIDFRGIARALVANIKSGGIEQGGSTITQQLARNAFMENPRRTIFRKLQEAIIAIQLERIYDKNEIFEQYLNSIYFGEGAYGVQAASQVYFGKDVSELSLSEAALLAGLVKAPSRYSPFKNPEGARTRRNVVLENMARYDFISEDEAERASQEPIKLSSKRSVVKYRYPYFTEYVAEEAEKLLQQNGYQPGDLYTAGFNIYTALDPATQEKLQQVFADPSFFPSSKTSTPVQGAMVVLDHSTGGIRALIGGRDYNVEKGFNRAVHARRQPGSAIKPLVVYAPAFERGYSPASVFDDVPVSYPGYRPTNYDGKYRGLINIREAVRWSVNVVAVKTLDAIGVDTGWSYGQKLGLPLVDSDRYLSLALGGITHGVSPLQMAAAYGALANQGMYIEPHAILKITDRRGNVIVEVNPPKQPVFTPETSFLMTHVLQTVVTSGTGTRAQLNRPVAGKTGTTQLPPELERQGLRGTKDAWFIGYTPEVVGAVWLGYDQTTKDNYLRNVAGGSYPAMIWKAVVNEAVKNEPVKGFPRPPGIVEVAIDLKSGLLPSPITPPMFIQTELFAAKNVPKTVSNVWVQAEICPESGMRAAPGCPTKVTGVFLQRPVPYRGSVRPLDADLELPSQICPLHGGQAAKAKVKICSDPRHGGKPVLANVPGPGQEGGCPPELVTELEFDPGAAPSERCSLPDHKITTSTTGPEPPGNGQTPPSPKLSAAATRENGRTAVRLTWTISGGKNGFLYAVTRWTKSNPIPQDIALTDRREYVDRDVRPGETYIYKVFTIDEQTDTSSASNTASVTLF